jgi:hypothetical protein
MRNKAGPGFDILFQPAQAPRWGNLILINPAPAEQPRVAELSSYCPPSVIKRICCERAGSEREERSTFTATAAPST